MENLYYLCYMIKLFEYEEKEIRTAIDDNQVWFSGQDIYNALGLTWKGAAELNKRKIPDEWVKKMPYMTKGGEQIVSFINGNAIMRIILSVRNRNEVYCKGLIAALGLNESLLKVNISESIFKQTVKSICDAFNFSCIFELPIGKYRSDIFIPKLGVIEFNEKHHNEKTDIKKYRYLTNEKGIDVYVCKIGEETVFYTRLIKKLMELGISQKELE